MDYIRRYCEWNKAIHKFYIENSNDDEIILYVDDNVLENIGKTSDAIKNDLMANESYTDHFLNTVITNEENRRRLPINPARQQFSLTRVIQNLSQTPASTRRIGVNRDIIHCLPFTILILYLYSRYNTEIGIKTYLQENGQTQFGFDIIPRLWERIEQDTNGRFNASRLAEGATQPNVGRMKFHLMVSPTQRVQYKNTLLENNLVWDDIQDDFAYFINCKVWRHLSNELKRKLEDESTRSIFESITRECNAINLNKEQEVGADVRKHLLYVYCNRLVGDTVKEYLWFKSDEPNPSYFCMSGDNLESSDPQMLYTDYENDLSHINVQYQTGVQTLRADGIKWSTYRSPLLFLKKVGDDIYEQTLKPEAGHSYLVICNNERHNQLRGQEKSEVTEYVTLFPDMSAFEISTWRNDNADNANEGEIGNLSSKYPKFSGIKSHDERGCYLSSAIPYIEFESPDKANEANITWEKRGINNTNRSTLTNKVVKGSRIYLNNVFTLDNDINHILLTINGMHYNLDIIKTVTKDLGTPAEYSYNKFGQVVRNSDEENTAHAHCARCSKSNIAGHQIENCNDSAERPILFDILTEASTNGTVSQNDFVEIIKYARKYHNLENNTETLGDVINDLKSLNCIIGFRDRNTGKYINQLQKPTLVKTPYKRSIGAALNLYMIHGCYTSHFIAKLKELIGDNKIIYRPHWGDTSIPDIALVDFPSQTIKNRVIDEMRIPVRETPFALDLIPFISDINENTRKYLGDDGNDQVSNKEVGSCPMISYDGRCTLHFVRNNHVVSRKQYYDSASESYEFIPFHFMKAYTCNKHERPLILLQPNSKNINDIYSFQKVAFSGSTDVNPLLSIALTELNLGLPKKKKVFIVNDDDNHNYMFQKVVVYNANLNKDKVAQLIEKTSGKAIDKSGGNYDWKSQTNALIVDASRYKGYQLYYTKVETSVHNKVETLHVLHNDAPVSFIKKHRDQRTRSVITELIFNSNNHWFTKTVTNINAAITDLIQGNYSRLKIDCNPYIGQIPELTNEDRKNNKVQILTKI